MLPGKRDFYRCSKARRSASHVNKEFRQQFQNYAPPSLRVIRTKFPRTIFSTFSPIINFSMSRVAPVTGYNIIYSTCKFCSYNPYFTMTKCNKLFITYLTRSTERLPSLPSSISTISTISMTVGMTTLLKKR